MWPTLTHANFLEFGVENSGFMPVQDGHTGPWLGQECMGRIATNMADSVGEDTLRL